MCKTTKFNTGEMGQKNDKFCDLSGKQATPDNFLYFRGDVKRFVYEALDL